jgi:RNA polymerase sigma factor (sigma-70 family)
MPELSETEQLRRIVDGFLSGDSEQHRRLREQIRRYVWRRYGADRTGHEDLVSEIVNALLVNLRAGRFRGNNLKTFSAYICGIARLKVGHAINSSDRTRDRASAEDVEDLPVSKTYPDHDAVADKDMIDKILGALEGECRELLTLKFHQGWSDGEIAAHKKKTKNAISTAISRCVKKVRGLEFVKELLY